jgi:uncharacterized protein (DUF433 family)
MEWRCTFKGMTRIDVPIEQIVLDERGVAYVAGTGLKVADIAIDAETWSHSPQQIQESFPKLSLSQIHAALSYYHDHRDEIDAFIAREVAECESLRTANPNPLKRAELERRSRGQTSHSG